MAELGREKERIKLTTSEEIHKLQVGKKCELIGYVDAMEAVKNYGQKRVFKFVLNNGNGIRIQVNCWNDEITKTEPEIELNNVIHLENASCTPNSTYNTGNFHGYEVSIGKYTIVESLGKFDKKNCEVGEGQPEILQTVPLATIMTAVLPWKFKTSGWIKTKITVIKAEDEKWNRGYFSVTDGTYKLDVTVNSYDESHGLEKGQCVELTGWIRYLKNDEGCFVIESVEDMELVEEEEIKDLNWLLKGNKEMLFKNPNKRKKNT